MIYEYVVYISSMIRPVQKAWRSNKFDWTRRYFHLSCTCRDCSSQNVRGDTLLKDSWLFDHQRSVRLENPNASTWLSCSCYSIYEDLQANPLFYRINTFQFNSPRGFIVFIAALTREKRALIRKIIFNVPDTKPISPFRWYLYLSHLRSRRHGMPHFLALLHQCQDLRSLTFIMNFGTEWIWPPHQDGTHLLYFLILVIFNAVRPPLDRPSLWNFPYLDFVVRLQGSGTIKLREVTEAQLVARPFSVQDYRMVYMFIWARNSFLFSRRPLFMGLMRRCYSLGLQQPCSRTTVLQMLKDLVSPPQLRDAINASHLDFPGEDRAAQDKMNSFYGTVSSRTRQRVERSKNVGPSGSIAPRSRGKYDDEGLLRQFVFKVTDIRHLDDRFQCKVLYDAKSKEESWEELESLLSRDGLEVLRGYYHSHVSRPRRKDPLPRLLHLESIPTPKEIIDMARGWMGQLIEHQPRTWAKFVREWDVLQTRYDARVAALREIRDNAQKTEK